MNRSTVPPGARMALLAITISMVLLAQHGVARADKVDRLINQLEHEKAYKVRLSAAINLAKVSDPRALTAFLRALSDADKNIRGIAATSLGRLTTRTTPARMRAKIERALEAAASKDASSTVRHQARNALQLIAGIDDAQVIYVDIGPMKANGAQSSAMKTLMQKSARQTFAQKATHITVEWPGGKVPSKRDLRDAHAFHIDGTLASLKATTTGDATIVSCKISMFIATYPKKSMFGFLDGGARVRTGSSPRDVQYAKEDCVKAVMEDLIVKKIVPTIRTRTAAFNRALSSGTKRSRRARRRSQ